MRGIRIRCSGRALCELTGYQRGCESAGGRCDHTRRFDIALAAIILLGATLAGAEHPVRAQPAIHSRSAIADAEFSITPRRLGGQAPALASFFASCSARSPDGNLRSNAAELRHQPTPAVARPRRHESGQRERGTDAPPRPRAASRPRRRKAMPLEVELSLNVGLEVVR